MPLDPQLGLEEMGLGMNKYAEAEKVKHTVCITLHRQVHVKFLSAKFPGGLAPNPLAYGPASWYSSPTGLVLSGGHVRRLDSLNKRS
jgi:hypothetical protein